MLMKTFTLNKIFIFANYVNLTAKQFKLLGMKKFIFKILCLISKKLVYFNNSLAGSFSIFWSKKMALPILLFFIFIFNNIVWGQITSSQSGDWNSTSTWSGGVVPSSGSAVIISSNHTVTVSVSTSCSSLTFTGTGELSVNSTVSLSISGALNLIGDANNSTSCAISGLGGVSCGSISIGSSITPNNPSRTATFTSSISSLTSAGVITLNSRISGVYTNNPSLLIQSGILTCSNITTVNPVGAVTSTVSLVSGSQLGTLVLTGLTPFTLDADGTNTINLNGSDATVNYAAAGNQLILNRTYKNLVVSNSGTKTLSGNTNVNGTLDVKKGCTLALSTFTLGSPTSLIVETGSTSSTISGSGTLTLGGNITVNSGSGSSGATISCPVALGTDRTINVNDDASATNDLTISGVISGSTFGISKGGLGTLILSGNNTYTGSTTITSGTIKLGVAGTSPNGPLGATAAGTTVNSGAVLDLNGFNLATTEALTINGTGISNNGALTNSSLTGATWQGTILLNSATSNYIGTTGGNITLTGIIDDGANTYDVVIVGTGTTWFSATNTYGGSTTVNPGATLYDNKAPGTGIPDNSAVAVNGILNLNSQAETIGALSGNGTISGTTSVLTVSMSGSSIFSGAYTANDGQLVKTGSGTLILTGTNTFYNNSNTASTTDASTGAAGADVIITQGSIEFGLLNCLSGSGANKNHIALNGGNLSTGSSVGYTQTLGKLNLTDNSTINLGTGSHTLTFAASNSATTWTAGKTLNISGWQGTAGSSGTAGKVFLGTSSSGLTVGQLSQIQFSLNSNYYAATILSSGEIVPSSTALEYRTVSNGNWSDISIWETSSYGSSWVAATQYPTSTANAISINHDVIFNVSISIDQTTIAASKTLTISSGITMSVANGSSDDLILSGTLVVNGVVSNNGAIQVNSGGYYNHANGSALPTGISWGSSGTTGTLEVSGSATCSNLISLSTTSELFNLIWSSSGALPTGGSSGSATLCNGDFTMNNSSASWQIYSSGSGSTSKITVGGNCTLSLGTINCNNGNGTGSGGASSGLDIVGNFNQSGGGFNIANHGSYTGGLYIQGNFTHTGGTFSSTGSGTVLLNRTSGTQTIESITGQSGAITFNVSGSNAQCRVASGKTFVQSSSTSFVIGAGSSTPDYYIFGTHTRTGTTFTTTGTMQVANGGTYQHNCNGQAVPAASWDSGALVNVTGITSTACTGLNQSFHHVTWNCASQTVDVNINSSLTWGGNLTVSSTGAGSNKLAISSGVGSYTLNVSGSVSISGGVLSLSNGASSGGGSMNVAGNLTVLGNGKFYCQTANWGGNLTVTGDLTTSGSAIFRGADLNYNSNSSMNFYGKVDMSTGTVGARSGTTNNGYTTINLYGTADTLKLPTSSMIYNENAYWDFNIKNGANITLQTHVYTGRTVTVETGGTLIMGTYVVQNMTNSAFTTQSGSTLKTANTGGIVTVVTGNSGSVQTATRTYNAGANYEFNGSLAQITGTGLPNSLTAGLTVNNSAGVTLSQATSSSGTVSLTNGYLTTTSTNLLTINNIATAAISSSNSAYINGPLKWSIANASASYAFPVGKSGSGYYPLTIDSYTSATSQSPTVEVFASNPSASYVGGCVSSSEYWKVNYSANAISSPIIKLQRSSDATNTLIGGADASSGSYTSYGGIVSGSGPYLVSATSSDATAFGTAKTRYYALISTAPSAPMASAQSFCTAASPTVASLQTTSGTNIKWYDAETNGNLLSNGTSLSAVNYYATQTVSGCESTTRTAVAVTLNSNGTWIGGASGNWSVSGNWCGGVPNSSDAVASIPNGVAVTLDASPTVLTFTNNSGGTVNLGSNTLSIASGGTFTNNGTFDSGTGTLAFLGSGTVAGGATTFNNLTTNGNLTVNASPTISGTLTLTSGTITVGANTLTLSGNISKADGNIDASNGSATLAFTNSSSLTLPSSLFTGNINNLTMNGAGGVTISSAITVANEITLTSGKLNLNGNTLTVGTTSSNGTISEGSASNYIVAYDNNGAIGRLVRHVNTKGLSYNYPIGDASVYAPLTVTINNTTGSLSSAAIEVYTKASKVTGMSASVERILNRSWIVEPSGITSPNYDIRYTYGTGEVSGSSFEVLDPIKLSGGTWYKPNNSLLPNGSAQGTATDPNTLPSNTLEWTGLTTFSEFGGAGGNSPLPVELQSFSGNCLEEQVSLEWKTASEHNSSYFDMEKSRDGENWTVLTTLPAAGSSVSLLTYNAIDANPTSENNYYRLKQVDIDGQFKMYNVINVTCAEKTKGYFSSFPNPSGDQFQVIINDKDLVGKGTMNILDSKGTLISKRELELKDGINMFVINEELESGIYFINYTVGKKSTKVLKHVVK